MSPLAPLGTIPRVWPSSPTGTSLASVARRGCRRLSLSLSVPRSGGGCGGGGLFLASIPGAWEGTRWQGHGGGGTDSCGGTEIAGGQPGPGGTSLSPSSSPGLGLEGEHGGGGGHSMVLSPTSHPHPPTGPVLAVPNHNPPSPFCQCGGGGDVPPLGVPLPHALPLCSPWPPLPHTLPHWPLLPHSPPLCTRRSHCYTPCPCADHGPAAPTLSAPIGPIAPQPAPLQAPAPIAPCIDPLPPNTIAPRSTPRPL